MSRIVLISDNPLGSPGGAEINDAILWDTLQCEFVTTSTFNQTLSRFKDSDLFILSNHYDLDQEAVDFLCERKFIHISHDMLLTHSRNPLIWENGIIPPNQLRNKKLFEKADVIVVQSTLHEQIFKKNLDANYYNLKGNLWSDKDFNLIWNLREKKNKNGRAFIVNSSNPIKGTSESEKFCRENKIPFDKVGAMGYDDFLTKLSDYSSYIGFPSWCIETFGRVFCEAKMLGVVPIGNDLVGFFSDYNGFSCDEVYDIMKGKKKELVELIKSYV